MSFSQQIGVNELNEIVTIADTDGVVTNTGYSI